ncbi:MAG: type II/IV secretion system ATPase subunit [Thermoplasmata archaeon]
MEGGRVKIYILASDSSTIYYIQEPNLTNDERSFLCSIRAAVPAILMGDRKRNAKHENYVDSLLSSFRSPLRKEEGFPNKLDAIKYYLERDLVGYGIIDPMIRDTKLEDISCTGPGVPIYVYHRSYGNLRSNRMFEERGALDSFVISLAQKGGKIVSVSDPILDSATPEGHRVSAMLGREVTSKGSTFSIRLFRKSPFSPLDLVRFRTASSELLAFMWVMAEWRRNVMVIGESGAGKTSTLNALSFFIPPWAKVVSIEDTREINIPHENWIPAVTRGVRAGGVTASQEGADVVDMFDLVRMALRQRPEYLIVGEIRGREAYSLFQAMSAGQTTLATMHAGSIASMFDRLENPPLDVPAVMLSSIDLVVKISLIKGEGRIERKISTVTGIQGIDPGSGEISTQNIFEWNRESDRFDFLYPEPYLRTIARSRSIEEEQFLDEVKRRAKLIDDLAAKGKDEAPLAYELDLYHRFVDVKHGEGA